MRFKVVLRSSSIFGLNHHFQRTRIKGQQRTYSKGITIQFKDEEESSAFHGAFEQWKSKAVTQGSSLPNGTVSSSKSKFDDKIEASSAKTYFH
ncbi:hypothetical protein Hdeb2414_s0008g00279031 [Helianthus debilis subsp. tardiflorus]